MSSIPLELLTAAEVRQADQTCGVPVGTLMENAGLAVVDAICARYAPRRVWVFAGTGNNGGDGRVAARHLRERGWDVSLAGMDNTAKASIAQGDLVVDAIFGVGLNRAPEGNAAEIIQAINQSGATMVAVDIPSGVMADSGATPGAAVRADLTVTFFRAKPGLFLLPGKVHAGEVQVVDIGIPPRVLTSIHPQCFLNAPALWRGALPALSAESHKYTRGHAVVAGGPLISTGASKLAALAALRSGAGLVSIACENEALPAYAAALFSVMTKPGNTAREYEKLIQDKRVNALLVGPGNGVSDATRQRMIAALESKKPCVLDADALTLLGENRKSLWKLLHPACVLTPHEGEFSRLFDPHLNPPPFRGRKEEGVDKLSCARAAAVEAGCTVLLKGNDTVIAAPDGRAAINANAPAWLATAGAGDVLSGIITGLLAQGMAPFEAACAGAWLHGEAASHSGIGMIAEDLPELLPRAWRDFMSC